MTTCRARRGIAVALTLALLSAPVLAAANDVPASPAPPYPPYPPPPPARRVYQPPPPPPPHVVDPPPLSPVARAVYAPFYVAGLIVRYGLYYVFVAPLEVFGRTVTYGAKGGVESPPPPPAPPPHDDQSR
jgi:hypothetical protein